MQLILPKNRGGLGLHDVERKCKSLLVNRFYKLVNNEYSYIRDNFIRSDQADAAQRTVYPSGFGYIKLIATELAILPSSVSDQMSSKSLYSYYVAKLSRPEIEKKVSPTALENNLETCSSSRTEF